MYFITFSVNGNFVCFHFSKIGSLPFLNPCEPVSSGTWSFSADGKGQELLCPHLLLPKESVFSTPVSSLNPFSVAFFCTRCNLCLRCGIPGFTKHQEEGAMLSSSCVCRGVNALNHPFIQQFLTEQKCYATYCHRGCAGGQMTNQTWYLPSEFTVCGGGNGWQL